MSTIVEALKGKSDFFCEKGASEEEIRNAEAIWYPPNSVIASPLYGKEILLSEKTDSRRRKVLALK